MKCNKWTIYTRIPPFVFSTPIKQMNFHGCYTFRENKDTLPTVQAPTLLLNGVLRNTICPTRSQWSKYNVRTNMAFWKTKPVPISSRHLELAHLPLLTSSKTAL